MFGNTGGGKSTLAKQLAEITGLPLYPLDLIQFEAGGEPVPHEDYLSAHADILARDAWIVDGYGCAVTIWQRLAAADTLVYLDLPLVTHFAWVTKRFLKAGFVKPEGWPEGSPIWRSTMQAYRVLWLCHRHLTPRYRRFVEEAAHSKRVHHLCSLAEIRTFLRSLPGEPAVERVDNEKGPACARPSKGRRVLHQKRPV